MANLWSILAVLVTMVVTVTYGFNPSLISCCQCSTMRPNLQTVFNPQIMPSPFRIVLPKDKEYYSPGIGVNVNLTSIDKSQSFHLYMIQARRINSSKNIIEPIGEFVSLDDSKPTPVCQQSFGYAFVSTGNSPKNHVRLEWIPPSGDWQGHIEFRATFIVDENVYWVKEKSRVLYGDPKTIPPKMRPRYIPPPISAIDTKWCGQTKGCYRIPEDCSEIECEYLVTWEHKIDEGINEIEFEMSTMTDGFNNRYFALALSEDIYCGNDLVFECVHNSTSGRVDVFQSMNSDRGNTNFRLNSPKKFLRKQEGSYNQGRLRCRFRRELTQDEETEFFNMKLKSWHLIMAHGMASNGYIKRHGISVGELPVSSPDEVDLMALDDISGRARYHMVKAHACLMLLAWIFFAPTGLIWMKYYSTMWPNSRLFGEKYWFVVHFNCTVIVVILVFIGVILALVEGGGWSNMPELPAKAHPILGIIAAICVFCTPILALFKFPNACINWLYWLFWTVAFCLAVVNIFIGMDFGKAMVPWWLTWIICLFFLFNLICEVILEVHQCCTHKKNKERRKKWELQKKEKPNQHIPEPWPAGRVFKRNVLFTHFIVSLIVVIIAVITVAVAN